jgi:hypothetical protein
MEEVMQMDMIEESLLGNVKMSDIKKIEIIHMPFNLLTRSHVSVDMLENSYYYKITIRNIDGDMAYLEKALQSTKINMSDKESDLRSGVILFDAQGDRIVSIYFDKSGSRGYLNSTPVSFNTNIMKTGLSKWVNKKVSGFY